ncbi:MAG TPA: SDR family oxidoreductase [Thermoleophilaceae bacterium]|jgi:NAD(P)-dependent dehydrogenase (short-subunit alcohol dehydrogenase family)|nr:SDR family oxidoreductase [Thermoleophilaceae bacterium]
MAPGAKDVRTLEGDVAIVTGAGSRIGAATARELARRGATVVLVARRMDDLQVHAHAIREAGGKALTMPADVGDAGAVQLLAERTLSTFGRVDVVVNNGDACWLATLESSSADEIARVVEVNLLSLMLLTRAVLPGMRDRRRGAIISVESLSGPVATEPAHAATKSGVRGFSLCLRRQVVRTGVSVSLVSLGSDASVGGEVMGRLPGPDAVAATIADLVTEPRHEVDIQCGRYGLASAEEAVLAPVYLAPNGHQHISQVKKGAT